MTNIIDTIQKRTHALIKKIPPEISPIPSILFSILAGYHYLTDNMIPATISLALSSRFATLTKGNTTDRIRDTFIFTGITLNPNIPLNIGLISMAAVIFLPHLASLRLTLSKQKIEPKISRKDIDLILIASTLSSTLIQPALLYALIIITSLHLWSFTELQYRTYKNNSKRQRQHTIT